MINSLLILGSITGKNKKLNTLFAIIWICYMLLNSNLKVGLYFAIINIISFSFIFALGQLIKGKYTNLIISIFSILIWSILTDIICYFVLPQFVFGQNIINCIWQGILFNYKYIFINSLVLGGIIAVEYLVKKIKTVKFESKLFRILDEK